MKPRGSGMLGRMPRLRTAMPSASSARSSMLSGIIDTTITSQPRRRKLRAR